MLSKILSRNGNNLMKQALRRNTLMQTQARLFSHGPYNPLHYKTVLVSEEMPSTEDYYATIKSVHSNPAGPLYNMRHIHPIR